MPTTYYSYIFVDDTTGYQAIITSSEVALPRPEVGQKISVNTAARPVAGVITDVSLDLVQDHAGGRTLTYQVVVEPI